MHFNGIRNLEVWNNVQPFQSGRNMVLATVTGSCGVNIHDNVQPGSVGVLRAAGSC